jgi:dinuclear metal center YbgI/SA1388 family protein
MTVAEVCAVIDELAPPDLAYPWDRIGLCIGDPRAKVKGVLVSLSVTAATHTAARRAKANLIISHHPPLWDPLEVIRTDDPNSKLCIDLAAEGISCYAAHTNLDVVPGGVNAVLAQRLGLVDTEPLFPVPHAHQVKLVTFVPESHLEALRQAVCGAGAGVIGEYSHCSFSAPGTGTFLPGAKARPFSGRKRRMNEEPERRFETLVAKARLPRVLEAMRRAHPYEEPAYDIVSLENVDPAIGLGLRGTLRNTQSLHALAAHVRDRLKARPVRIVGKGAKRVRRIAVLGGSGGSEIANLPRDIDAYVTGDVKYHEAQEAEARGIGVIDAGHAATEKWVVPVLARHLRGNTRGLTVTTHTERELFDAL